MAERLVLVDEVSRRWLCGEIDAPEYFAAARAAGHEAARRDVSEHLSRVAARRACWARFLARLVGNDVAGPVKRLEGPGKIVEAEGTPSGWRVVDPLLTRWIRLGRHQ